MAGLFCRLHRQRLTGLVHVESGERYLVVSLRDGSPVFVEEASSGRSIGDDLVERGELTREQYAEIVSGMTESLVDNEDKVFCDQGIELGYLTPEQVRAAMSERVRGKLIQALGLRDCRVEIDDSGGALSGTGEYPQELGPIIYMGVRTFYDDEYLAALVPDPTRSYLRLSRPLGLIASFFGLDADEVQLLRAVSPEAKLSTAVTVARLDASHVLSLVGLLYVSEMAELSPTPFSAVPPSERSGVLSTGGVSAPRERPRSKALPEPPRARADAPPSPARDVAAEALAEAKARAARERRRPAAGPAAAQRLGQQLRRLRNEGVTQALDATPPPGGPLPPDQAEYAKAHLRQLLMRRKQNAAGAVSQAVANKRDAAQDFRAAQEALRDQKYSRAEELLRVHVAANPSNEVYQLHHLWARLRAGAQLEPKHSELLRELAKKLARDDAWSGFACYVLGHVSLLDKRDDLAEKFFRKALSIDKTNKDAERHVRVLERRKALAAEAEAAANKKIFGITISSTKKE